METPAHGDTWVMAFGDLHLAVTHGTPAHLSLARASHMAMTNHQGLGRAVLPSAWRKRIRISVAPIGCGCAQGRRRGWGWGWEPFTSCLCAGEMP